MVLLVECGSNGNRLQVGRGWNGGFAILIQASSSKVTVIH